MHATEIVGYTFNADIYCPECIVDTLPTGPGEAFDGWKLAPGVRMSTEANLSEIAEAFGIDRLNENTYDSSEFPKVIFASDVQGEELCARCGRDLIDG